MSWNPPGMLRDAAENSRKSLRMSGDALKNIRKNRINAEGKGMLCG